MGWAGSEERRKFYERRREKLRRMYWEGNDSSDLLRPNGFREYPEEVYNLFLSLIDGDMIDLGCGNGLMLRHLVERSRFRLVPHGVDFIEESIRQAREVVLPEYAENFWVANVADADLGEESYDFIFFDPYAVHPADLGPVVRRVIRASGPAVRHILRLQGRTAGPEAGQPAQAHVDPLGGGPPPGVDRRTPGAGGPSGGLRRRLQEAGSGPPAYSPLLGSLTKTANTAREAAPIRAPVQKETASPGTDDGPTRISVPLKAE